MELNRKNGLALFIVVCGVWLIMDKLGFSIGHLLSYFFPSIGPVAPIASVAPTAPFAPVAPTAPFKSIIPFALVGLAILIFGYKGYQGGKRIFGGR
ncbi:MAG: hypothetical protein JWM44_3277 [Bacilli bacterium]|nr:hypothetical protein [Bacilli bacterium]